MAPHKRYGNNSNISVSEDFKINCERILNTFMQDITMETYEFPSTLTNVERAFVHNYAKKHYSTLKTKSHGNGSTRRLVLSKRNLDIANLNRSQIRLRSDNIVLIQSYLSQLSTFKEQNDFQQLKSRMKKMENYSDNKLGLGYGVPQIPTIGVNPTHIHARSELPVWMYRDSIIQNIIDNQVLIICGQTGSGKTTQIPQFILDYSASCAIKCRIVCTQPRRISAISVANRVAVERGENTGQTVGFHIRLESCASPKTSLIYCTNGILLRTLMGGDTCLSSVTHIIVDEIHERDRFSDFLLICLRECLLHYPNLRLILMSATLDTNSYQTYFKNAPVITIPGRLHNVSEYFLEDILSLLSYESQAMFQLKKKQSDNQMVPTVTIPVSETVTYQNDYSELPVDLRLELEHTIYECVNDGSEDAFNQLLNLVLSEDAPINYQHPQTGYTGLIAAAMHGNTDMCLQLLSFGADINIRCKRDKYTAMDWAMQKTYYDCYKTMIKYTKENDIRNDSSPAVNENKIILDLYHRTISDQNIDFDLVQNLLYHIYLKTEHGSILVFLSGYDDIVNMKDRIIADTRFNSKKYQIITLHSMMQIADQNAIFSTSEGRRKIILSTNIAETSITIEDVVYIIDSGKVKERCYDALAGISSLQLNWISKAAAKQRAGRAGRTQSGTCFHLFSQNRYSSMQEYATAEILRMPLHELCLQTKMLAPCHVKIAEFLSRALEPPSILSINNAIKHLQEINALDENETLTILGQHLVDLPVEPRLAKMLLYSVIFKCIDPILTIVAFESQRDPFLLPALPHQKAAAMENRKRFSNGTYSDHMILLRVFQEWQDARLKRSERVFCSENFVSPATMDMVIMIRSQLLAQLRATGFVRTKPPGDIRDLNENANNWPLIKSILTLGLFPNIAFINRTNMQIRTKNEKKVYLNKGSALNQLHSGNGRFNEHVESLKNIPSNWLVYDEISRSNTSYTIRSVTNVSPITIALFADNSTTLPIRSNDGDSSDEDLESPSSNIIVINDWIAFEGNIEILNLITSLRQKLNRLAMKKIAHPHKYFASYDEGLIKLISNILLNEDKELKFTQPEGIGNRPKIMSSGCDVNRQNRYQNKNSSRNPRPASSNGRYVNEYRLFKHETNEPNSSSSSNIDTLSEDLNTACNVQTSNSYSYDNLQTYNPFAPSTSSNPDHTRRLASRSSDATVYGKSSMQFSQTQQSQWNNQVRSSSSLYFLIKTPSLKSIDVSISKKSWVFSPQTERKLTKAFQTGRNIILIFTVATTKCFNGIARLVSVPANDFKTEYTIQCILEWYSRADIPYEYVQELNYTNLFDGYELNATIGIQLWDLFCNYIPQVPVQHEPIVVPSAGRAITKLDSRNN